MPAPHTFTPPRSTRELPKLVDLRIVTPRESAIEARLAAIEARLKREDDERAIWEGLNALGLVRAA